MDENHPEVIRLVTAAVKEAELAPITLSPEVQVEVLEGAIRDWEKEMRNKKKDGPL